MSTNNESKSITVEVQSTQEVHSGFLKIKQYVLKHIRFNGAWSEWMTREVMVPPNEAVAVLLADVHRKEFVLVEQFRMGPLALSGTAQTYLEVVAGYHESGATLAESACREVLEETGISIASVEPICAYWVSPGASGERVNLFYAEVDATQAQSHGGCEDEHEDIRIHRIAFDDVFNLIKHQQLDNAMTLLCLQWFQLNKLSGI